jgi:hypothetical protein
VGVFGSLVLCINVRNTDVNDALSPASPEASNQDVATVFRAIVLEEARGLILAPQRDWYGFLVRRELRRGKRPRKQGRSARLESHCAVRLRVRHAYIQAHGER